MFQDLGRVGLSTGTYSGTPATHPLPHRLPPSSDSSMVVTEGSVGVGEGVGRSPIRSTTVLVDDPDRLPTLVGEGSSLSICVGRP